MEEHAGQHSIFDTVGTSHTQGQFHFEVNDGVARWFHRDEKQKVVFETMAHTVAKGEEKLFVLSFISRGEARVGKGGSFSGK